MENLKRMSLDIILFVTIMVLFVLHSYLALPAALQLLALKALLVSGGVLHAHITRKLVFPKVDWNGPITGNTIMVIALYVVTIYAYSMGG